jgi:hypothetical protein
MLNRFEKVFASLLRHEVRYVVIGGVAAIMHGVPRSTISFGAGGGIYSRAPLSVEALTRNTPPSGNTTAINRRSYSEQSVLNVR